MRIPVFLCFDEADSSPLSDRCVRRLFQKSKVPFLYNYVVTYTRKGKPYQASTGLVFKNKIPKIGAKHMYDIVTYSSGGKKLIQAKKLKRQMSKA